MSVAPIEKNACPSASWLPSRMTCSGASDGFGSSSPTLAPKRGQMGPQSVAVALAAVNGVLQALFGARVVPPVAIAEGDRDVGLLHVREHLLVELVAQAVERSHHRLGVGVFSLEVGGDLGVLFVAQPGVVVDEDCAVQGESLCVPCGRWGAEEADSRSSHS